MMEHILMHDWYDNKSSDEHFVKEEDIDNCATERLLRNEFHDPLASSNSEDEATPYEINWDRIFKKRNQPLSGKYFVPCLRRSPLHLKLSELNQNQHKQFLKIICAEHPNVLKKLFLGKPTKQDFKAFEAAKEIYLKEQKVYQDWAKTLWLTDHCIRTLRPKPSVARVYEAECRMRAHRMQALPKLYNLAAHITLENGINNCDAVLKQDLIRVTLADMPNVQIPDHIDKQLCIIRPCTVPEPCQKHPYQIVLPNEDALSMLPITEIHHVLASFAVKNNAHFIASENALKCLTQWNRHWLLPLSVCETIGPDGVRMKVLVLGSEFTVHKEAAHMRTYKAFRHLLEHALIPLSEKQRIWEAAPSRATNTEGKVSHITSSPKLNVSANPVCQPAFQDADLSSDDEDSHLFIDIGEESLETAEPKFTNFSSPKAGSEPSTSGLPPTSELDESISSVGPTPAKQKRVDTDVSPRRSTRISGHVTESPSRVSVTNSPARISRLVTESPPRISGQVMKSPPRISGQVMKSPPRISGQVMKSPVRISRLAAVSPPRISGQTMKSPARISRLTKKVSEEYPVVPDIGVYSCTCKGTLYEKPPRRSFKKWEISKKGTNENLDIVIHCSHKAKDKSGEVLVEPLPEYQLDLGASEQKPDVVRSVALSLALRENTSVLNVRVDGSSGEVVTFEKQTSEEFNKKHPGAMRQVIGTVHAALSQLQALKPGHYVLQHEPTHGPNAMLMCPLSPGQKHTLELNFDADELIRVDEAEIAKLPPTITTDLLPYHKHRRMLPCAFTPYENMVAKQTKKPPPQPKKKAPQANKLQGEQSKSGRRRKASKKFKKLPP